MHEVHVTLLHVCVCVHVLFVCIYFFFSLVNVEMKNHFGFLSLVDYPAMIVSIHVHIIID